MTGSQVRQKFLDYFSARGHRVVRSSSLMPANDPTLLFTNAGMNQFKDVFLGQEKRDYARAATSQKCVRAGGKHNDLDNVGYTRRHHTFFEMLGNFSFGDYFKSDAIAFAWELITKEYGLPKDKLYVTVFREDDEAEELWQKVAGVPKDRIFRLDEKDNFWQMGDTGPCGPCSEIHYDLGPEAAEPGREQENFPDDGGGRFVEIWNLVFMQYDRDSDGKLTPLPRPSIDTGMGLERIAAVKQGVLSNYDTDLLKPIVHEAARLLGVVFQDDEHIPAHAAINTVLRINADHARAAAFLINDGVVPSNDGRGYVLRKIMRRAIRNARMTFGQSRPYFHELTNFVAKHMADAYPEMMDSRDRVARVIRDEERRYATTVEFAEKVFYEEAAKAPEAMPGMGSRRVLPGNVSFKLYDTYGLSFEEQQDMAREAKLVLDPGGFEVAMAEQRRRARASWKGAEKGRLDEAYGSALEGVPPKEFVRDRLETPQTFVQRVFLEGPMWGRKLQAGDTGEVVLDIDKMPFYPESGGQVGDRGELLAFDSGEQIAEVLSARKVLGIPILSVHALKPINQDESVIARVDPVARLATMRNHTGTHLLHAALRMVLGTHVKQAGSVVEPLRLRFDFSHYTSMDAAEIAEVERLMNEEILANREVHTDVMDLDQALSTGAMALFGEKYGDKVRVVSIDEPGGGIFSKELCGGTHVTRTGDIGMCKIVYEGSISAGVRRIEAVTGEAALRRFQETQAQLARVASVVRTSEAELIEHVEKLLAKEKSTEQELQQIKTKMAQSQAGDLELQAREIKGVKVLAARVDGFDRAQLRTLADSLRNKWKSAVVVLAAAEDSNVSIVTGVTKDLTAKVHAGKLAGAVAQAVGGKGGGRPDMAEAGGKDPAALDGALANVYVSVEEML